MNCDDCHKHLTEDDTYERVICYSCREKTMTVVKKLKRSMKVKAIFDWVKGKWNRNCYFYCMVGGSACVAIFIIIMGVRGVRIDAEERKQRDVKEHAEMKRHDNFGFVAVEYSPDGHVSRCFIVAETSDFTTSNKASTIRIPNRFDDKYIKGVASMLGEQDSSQCVRLHYAVDDRQ